MKMNVRFLCESAVIAALYAVLTWVLAPISYGPIQFRISEILVLLVFLNPKYAYSIIIGCFVANTTSSLGWYDMVFGTLATTLAVLPMIKTKKIGIAAIYPVISNAIIISLELWLAFKEPGVLFLNLFTIAIGEAVVLYGLGIPFYMGLSNNSMICELLEIDNTKINNKELGIDKCLYILFGILYIIIYFALPICDDVTIFSLTKSNLYLISYPLLCILFILFGLLIKNKIKSILNIIILLMIISLWLISGIKVNDIQLGFYYYICYLIYFLNILICIKFSNKGEVNNE